MGVLQYVAKRIGLYLAVLFIGLAVPALGLLAVTGSIAREGIAFGVGALPVVMLAGYAGDRAARRLTPGRFRRISLVTIYATGLFGVVSGLR